MIAVDFEQARAGEPVIYTTAGGVSNTHWWAAFDRFKVRPSLKSSAKYDVRQLSNAPGDLLKPGVRVPYQRTPLEWKSGEHPATCFVNTKGDRVWFRTKYVDVFKISTVWGTSPADPFTDGGETYSLILMPFTPPRDDQAMAVLASTSAPVESVTDAPDVIATGVALGAWVAEAMKKAPGGKYACYCSACVAIRLWRIEGLEKEKLSAVERAEEKPKKPKKEPAIGGVPCVVEGCSRYQNNHRTDTAGMCEGCHAESVASMRKTKTEKLKTEKPKKTPVVKPAPANEVDW